METKNELSNILNAYREKNDIIAHRFMALPSNGVDKINIVTNDYAFLWYMPRTGNFSVISGQWHELLYVCKEMKPQNGVVKMTIDMLFEGEKKPFMMLVDKSAKKYLGKSQKLEYGSLYKTPHTNILVYNREQFLHVPKEKIIHECMRLVNL